MGKSHSPLLGFNNNVRHKNRVFHIQTEDSGIKHPHIITHLFMDGGRILKSVKKSYAEHVGTDAMQDTVRQMMKEQHKAMFIALRDGQFDAVVEEQVAAKAKYDAAPAVAPKGSKTTSKADRASQPAPPAPHAESAASPEAIAEKDAAPISQPVASQTVAKKESIKPAASPSPPVVEEAAAAPPAPPPQAASPAPPPAASPPPQHVPPASPEYDPRRPPARQTQAGLQAVRPQVPGQPPPLPARASQRQPAVAPLDAPPASASAPRSLTPGGKNRLVVLPEPDEQPPTTTRDPDRAPPPSLDIDLDATPGTPASALFGANDLPPPPEKLFKKEITASTYRTVDHGGGYRGVDATEGRARPKSNPPAKPPPLQRRDPTPGAPPVASRVVPQKPPPPQKQPMAAAPQKSPAPAAPQKQAAPTPSTHPSSPGRYAPARPATIFGQPRGKGSLFGDDLVSDKSLDEVILSYLAEDLEQSPKKK